MLATFKSVDLIPLTENSLTLLAGRKLERRKPEMTIYVFLEGRLSTWAESQFSCGAPNDCFLPNAFLGHWLGVF